VKELRAGTPVAVGPMRIIPLERVRVGGSTGGGGLFLFGSKTPVGVVICTPERCWALDLDGNPMPLEAVLEGLWGWEELVQTWSLCPGGGATAGSRHPG